MDGGLHFDTTRDLDGLVKTCQRQDSKSTTDLSKGKKNISSAIPHSSLAYLGPQIWSNTVIYENLNMETIILDDLLNEGSPSDDLPDISEMLSFDQNQKNHQHEAIGSAKDSAEVTAHSTTEGNQDLVVLSNTRTFNLPAVPSGLVPSLKVPLEGRTFSYKPDITDVMISTSVDETGESTEFFDPTKRPFTEDELKPQPILRKAKKVYVPEDSKDARYWQKREKNNTAAKRSRDARRIKENQIAMRTTFLEKENNSLKNEVKELRAELVKMVEVISGYKARESGK